MERQEWIKRLQFQARLEVGGQVGNRLVLRIEVEQDADIAELETAVNEGGPLVELRGGRDRHVDRDRGPANAALGTEDSDHLTGVVDRRGSNRSSHRNREPLELLPLASIDLADGGGQLVRAERLDQELARSSQHRAAQVVRLTLDRHHHDRGARHGGRELLRRFDSIHVRHVDVHQDDIGLERSGQLDGLPSRIREAHDLDITFEAKQPRQVIAGLADVVDDEDADLICHWIASWPSCSRWWWFGWPARSVRRARDPRGSVAPVRPRGWESLSAQLRLSGSWPVYFLGRTAWM